MNHVTHVNTGPRRPRSLRLVVGTRQHGTLILQRPLKVCYKLTNHHLCCGIYFFRYLFNLSKNIDLTLSPCLKPRLIN